MNTHLAVSSDLFSPLNKSEARNVRSKERARASRSVRYPSRQVELGCYLSDERAYSCSPYWLLGSVSLV